MSTSVREIEELALSALMNVKTPEGFEILMEKASEHDFGYPGHSDLFNAIVDANDATGGADRTPTMIWAQIVKRNLASTLEKEGIDKRYIEAVHAYSIDMTSGIEYLSMVRQHGGNLRLAKAGAEIVEIARMNKPMEEAIAMADSLIDVASGGHHLHVTDIRDGVDDLFDSLMGIKVRPYFRIPTHIPYFDRVLEGGLQTGTLNFFTAPSSHGKSTMLRNIAAQIAYHEADNVVVGWNPIEEGTEKLKLELVSYWTGHGPWLLDEPEPAERKSIGIGRMSLFQGGIEIPTPEQKLEMQNARVIYEASNIRVFENAVTKSGLQASVRQLRRQNKDKVLVVVLDYLDHMSPDRPGENEVQHLTDVVRFMRHSTGNRNELDNRGLYLVAVQLRSDALGGLSSITESTRPLELFNMTQMKGASAIHQAADTAFGSLITVNPDENSAQARGNKGRRFHIDALKNKINGKITGSIFYQDMNSGWLREA